MKVNVKALSYPLPPEIAAQKAAGDFPGALASIERRLKEEISAALRQRLELEQEVLPRLEAAYPYSERAALALLGDRLRDFKPTELEKWREAGAADWIYRGGKIYYIQSFYDNLIRNCPDAAARRKRSDECENSGREAVIRAAVQEQMRRDGGAACRLKLRASMTLHVQASDLGKPARVWLPVPVEYAQVSGLTLHSGGYTRLSAPQNPQRTALFEGTAAQLGGVSLCYTLTNKMQLFAPDDARVSRDQPQFYLHEELPHIAFTPYLRALAAELTEGERNPLRRARNIYDFITKKSPICLHAALSDASADCGILCDRPARRLRCAGADLYCAVQALRRSRAVAVRPVRH